ncbi:hypothetical protein THAOC_02515 [Thalassiosira oceanica]|uniref:Uncharacterized protein n=1 Tax=Thalassiosira oceanica TaxID=159749 RepID=K0TFE8_THAOC|nr:hypothetical protein THAOC_02515 [Thalassiosira oceanica]|eukprot:EJK75754.1 hypothetical protein THAOC_02515 [Thalassiosira oceanica]
MQHAFKSHQLVPRGHALLASTYALPQPPLVLAVRVIGQLSHARAADFHRIRTGILEGTRAGEGEVEGAVLLSLSAVRPNVPVCGLPHHASAAASAARASHGDNWSRRSRTTADCVGTDGVSSVSLTSQQLTTLTSAIDAKQAREVLQEALQEVLQAPDPRVYPRPRFTSLDRLLKRHSTGKRPLSLDSNMPRTVNGHGLATGRGRRKGGRPGGAMRGGGGRARTRTGGHGVASRVEEGRRGDELLAATDPALLGLGMINLM